MTVLLLQRITMRILIPILFLLLPSIASAADHPNIIFMLADDQILRREYAYTFRYLKGPLENNNLATKKP
jgi:hypothetical protein